ncbi:GntR family transcriptional regulator [Pelagibacterium luteolum]|uniref:DNA-binding transcriptional regulator, GntR family n=1 Tax=Pelagibacterium luteolum TaxID=440168 RepID=A0A1G7VGP2_9HYPH|nr:GntR family transcriptional regulator [Pelagibacterium luteolum]SDG58741.1 DNA-binding transcriptional regulator, GntR family [Pelagibacterium luteolum]
MSEVLASSERKTFRPRPRMGLAELMRDDIVSGALPAGSLLKTIELSKRYGVSTNPVREALHQLSGEGFVVLSRNRSAQVRSLDETFVRNIFDIRTLIEPYLIRVFVEQARKDDLDRARAVQKQLEASHGDQIEWDSLDEEFHGIMYKRHFNDEARAIRQRHGEVVRALARRYPISPARRVAVLKDHWDIIDAVEAHDADLAATIVERHARGAERHLLLRMREAL